MKLSSTWFALILIASALLLRGGPNVNADELKSHRTPHHQAETTPQPKPVENKEPEVPLAVWQATMSALRESIADNKQQALAAQKGAEANKQTFCSPAVVVNEILALVGVGYLIFMYLQWSAIDEQAKIANNTLIETRKSADAAAKNAGTAEKTLLIAERPYLSVVIHRTIVLPQLVIEYSLLNSGRTPAFVYDLRHLIRV